MLRRKGTIHRSKKISYDEMIGMFEKSLEDHYIKSVDKYADLIKEIIEAYKKGNKNKGIRKTYKLKSFFKKDKTLQQKMQIYFKKE